MEDLCAHNLNHSGCIIFAGFKSTEIKAYSAEIGVPVLDGNLDPLSEPIVISDLEQAKGYEFDTVIVVNCEAGILPKAGIPPDEIYRSACQFYVSMTRAKNDLYLSYHDNPSDWLVNTIHLHRYDWSVVEDIKEVRLLPIPRHLVEMQNPNKTSDIYTYTTGLEFIYTNRARGLSVEHQTKLVELVDGRGMYSKSKDFSTKWRDMRSLINNVQSDPKVRSFGGPSLTEFLLDLN